MPDPPEDTPELKLWHPQGAEAAFLRRFKELS